MLSAGLPNITGQVGPYAVRGGTEFASSGALTSKTSEIYTTIDTTDLSNGNRIVIFNANKSNPIYGASTTVRPPALQQIPNLKL